MDRVLPAVLAGSGPRWLGAAAMLALVAAQTGDVSAAAQLRDALLPYRGLLVVLGGANGCMGPVSFFLGLLGARLGLLDEAVGCLQEAIAFAESAGALPGQVLSLEHAAGALSLRQAPGDREKASACRVRAAAIAERLGVTGMLGRLASASGQWALRRDGEDWLLEAGAERARLRDSRGLHYLRAYDPGRNRPHHAGRPDRRGAPAILDPHRHGMPVPARGGRPGPLAHLNVSSSSPLPGMYDVL